MLSLSPSVVALCLLGPALTAAPPPAPPAASPEDPIPTLSVRELSEQQGNAMAPTARARALAGSRVRILGYMARQEEPSPGGFWLTSRPVECDEGGGGTADLPPGSVRVLVSGEPPAPIDGPIAVIGVFEVGNRSSEGGAASAFRLRIDRPLSSSPPQPVHQKP